ncbi:acid phosphatase 1-like [Curcuma longa]|uniref:acid phosphatase 1-like n=1 Tax=Curcuma longa TaxID=136217 RepID=UPI003D9E0379
MLPFRSLALLLLISLFAFTVTFASADAYHSLLRMLPGGRTLSRPAGVGGAANDYLCGGWRLSVETNNAGPWYSIPSKCIGYVKKYFDGDQYYSDSKVVAADSLNFAATVTIEGDGKDIWIFDIDETLLSNLPYYALHGYGSETYNETSFNEWVELGEAPALPASLKLYGKLLELGFQIVLLTGRDENQRNVTVENLLSVGYSSWEQLILRQSDDHKKKAVVYKSERRAALEAEGFRIHGNSGDQWSDLLGWSTSTRSFKLPDPMYYIG